MSDRAAQAHYAAGPDLRPRILEALAAAGRPVDPLDPDDLANLDEFHGLGRAGDDRAEQGHAPAHGRSWACSGER